MIDIGADLQRAFDEGYEKGKADRPQGEWFKDDEGTFICSACGSGYKDQPTLMGKPLFKWCPLCGAKMKGADEVEWVYNKRERLWYPYLDGELLFKTENSSKKPNSCDTCRKKGFEGCEQPCLGCGCCGLYEPKDESEDGSM